jgi:hypothetical protein
MMNSLSKDKLVQQLIRWALNANIGAGVFDEVSARIYELQLHLALTFNKRAKGMKFKTPGQRRLAEKVFMTKAIRTLLDE